MNSHIRATLIWLTCGFEDHLQDFSWDHVVADAQQEWAFTIVADYQPRDWRVFLVVF